MLDVANNNKLSSFIKSTQNRGQSYQGHKKELINTMIECDLVRGRIEKEEKELSKKALNHM